ncbi:lipopolysaccharide biosynthesis protein [Fusobacterium varium]|uniref:lipopolysaccharide biosynthesis protein n=1 Tax=Fusobacterium varium TaxID=856 RepID=UPI003119C28C
MEMKNNSKLIKGSIYYLVSNCFNKGINFIIIIYLSKILIPEYYGIILIANTLRNILLIVGGVSVTSSILVSRNEFGNEFNDYLKSLLIFQILIGILSIFLVPYYSEFLKIQFGLTEDLVYVILISTYLELLYEIINQKNIALNNYNNFFCLNILNGVFNLIIIIILYQIMPNNYYAKVYSNLILYLGFGVFSSYIIYKESKKSKIKIKYIKFAVLYSIPIVFHQLSHFILSSSDKLMIDKIYTKKEVGYYGLAYNIGMIFSIIIVSFGRNWFNWLNEQIYNDNIDEIKKKSNEFRIIFFLLTCILVITLPEIFKLIVDSTYFEVLNLIPLIILSYYLVFLYSLYADLQLAKKKHKLIWVGTILAGGINILLNYLYLEKYTYKFAAVSTIISYLFLLLFHFIFCEFIYKIKIYRRYFLLIEILGMSIYIYFYYFYIKVSLCILIIIFFCFLFFIKKLNRKK